MANMTERNGKISLKIAESLIYWMPQVKRGGSTELQKLTITSILSF